MVETTEKGLTGEKRKEGGESRAMTIKMVGGRLCLDFANTVDWRLTAAPEEILPVPGDLAKWAFRAGLLTETERDRSIREETIGEGGLARAVVLREAVFGLFFAAAAGETPGSRDLAVLNEFLDQAMAPAEVIREEKGFSLVYGRGKGPVEKILGAVARDAARLLTSEDSALVKICGDEGCGWLFLDTSRNRSRRWCDMKGCGNRAKARRFYRRRKTGGPAG